MYIAPVSIPFTVVGILERTYSSFDNICFTQLKSIWDIHEAEHDDEDEDEDETEETEEPEEEDAEELKLKYGCAYSEEDSNDSNNEDKQYQVTADTTINSKLLNDIVESRVEEIIANQEVESEKVIYSEEPTFIGILTNGKSQSMIAKEVADKIEEIRKAKFNIISGYYETALDPLTLKKMYDELDAMEKEYTSLFVGKRIGKQVVKTVYVTPSKEVATQTVAKFSEEDGLSVGTSGVGNPITVQTLSMNATSNISTLSQSALESMSHENKVFYRIPETANVKVMYDNQVLVEKREVVNQLGVLLLAPVSNMGLLFDPNTGQIVNMKMK